MVVDGVVVVVEGVMVAEDSTIEAGLEAAVGEDLAKGVFVFVAYCELVFLCLWRLHPQLLQPGFSVRMQHLPKTMDIK